MAKKRKTEVTDEQVQAEEPVLTNESVTEDYVVRRGCVQHNGQRFEQGNVITLSGSEAQRLLNLGVIVSLAEMKGDGRTG